MIGSEISEQSQLQVLIYIVLQMQVCVTASWYFHGTLFFYLFLAICSLTKKSSVPAASCFGKRRMRHEFDKVMKIGAAAYR
jgi:hypothetical protein